MKCILKRGSLRLRRPNGARDQFVLAATDLRDGPAKQEIWHGDAIAETAVETESSCRRIAWWAREDGTLRLKKVKEVPISWAFTLSPITVAF